jgi:hypothetical protein
MLAINLGIIFTGNEVLTVSHIALIEGIDAVRNTLNRCWFDEIKCSSGIKALENYKKEWNDRHGCWSNCPLHNFASHGADAFRMLAVAIGKLTSKGLSAEDWKSLRRQYI